MPKKADHYVISIEPVVGSSFKSPLFVGSNIDTARNRAVWAYNTLNSLGCKVRTVALLKRDSLVDVYDGSWDSDREFWE